MYIISETYDDIASGKLQIRRFDDSIWKTLSII